jgi:hypothetical protein
LYFVQETTEESDAAMTTLTWFVLATVTGELGAIALTRR